MFGLHGSSKCTTEVTRRQLNKGQLQAGQSGEYRHMAKIAICTTTSPLDDGLKI
jgi:hypothetical protein